MLPVPEWLRVQSARASFACDNLALLELQFCSERMRLERTVRPRCGGEGEAPTAHQMGSPTLHTARRTEVLSLVHQTASTCVLIQTSVFFSFP